MPDLSRPTTPPPSELLLLSCSAPFQPPWGAVRRLFSGLQTRLPPERIAAALSPHRAVLSLVLVGLLPGLTAEEHAVRERSSNLVLGRVGNMLPTALHISAAWAAVLAELIPPGAALWVPDLAALDPESLSVVRPLLVERAATHSIPMWIGGSAPTRRDPAAPDRRALEESVEAEQIVVWLLRDEGPKPPAADTEEGESSPESPLDPQLEAGAWRRLADPAELAGWEVDTIRAATRQAFDCLGFPATVRLARRLLERVPRLKGDAELRTLIGISRYALHPAAAVGGSLPDEAASIMSEFELALETETDPRLRAHLIYRLSVISGRGRRDQPGALRWGDMAVRQAGDVSSRGSAAFLEARALGARAFPQFRSGRLQEALADCQRAIVLLDTAEAEGVELAQEINVARVIILDNLARLHHLLGDRASGRAAQARAVGFDRLLPRFRQPPYIWSFLFHPQDNLEGSIVHVEQRLARAEVEKDLWLVAELSYRLGDWLHRRGENERPRDLFRRARQVWEQISPGTDDRLTALQAAAITSFHGGDHEEADRGFALLASALEDADARCELSAARLWVAGAAFGSGRPLCGLDQPDELRERVSLALERARRMEDLGGRIRSFRCLAEASAALGDLEEARSRLLEAISAAGRRRSLPAEDLLGLHVSLLALGGGSPTNIRAALRLLPQSLSDPSAWWELPRLLPLLRSAVEARFLPRNALYRRAIDRAVEAGLEREDCRAMVEEIARARARPTRRALGRSA